MVDTGVVGCNWIELPAGKYKLRSPLVEGSVKSEVRPVSHCQFEVDIAYDEFISHAPEGKSVNTFFFIFNNELICKSICCVLVFY